MSIRRLPPPLSDRDLATVAAIEAAALPGPWGAVELRRTLDTDGVGLWTADGSSAEGGGDGMPRAFCITQQILDELHILQVATHPAARRQGLARALLAQVLHAAREGGCAQALLEVRQSNDAAIALYAALGFEAVGRRRRYYRDTGEDALLLSCFL